MLFLIGSFPYVYFGCVTGRISKSRRTLYFSIIVKTYFLHYPNYVDNFMSQNSTRIIPAETELRSIANSSGRASPDLVAKLRLH